MAQVIGEKVAKQAGVTAVLILHHPRADNQAQRGTGETRSVVNWHVSKLFSFIFSQSTYIAIKHFVFHTFFISGLSVNALPIVLFRNFTGKCCWLICGVTAAIWTMKLLGIQMDTNQSAGQRQNWSFNEHFKHWFNIQVSQITNPATGFRKMVQEYFGNNQGILKNEQAVELFYQTIIGTVDNPGAEAFGIFSQQLMERVFTPTCESCGQPQQHQAGRIIQENILNVPLPDIEGNIINVPLQDEGSIMETLEQLVLQTFTDSFDSYCSSCSAPIKKERRLALNKPNQALIVSLQRTRQASYVGANVVKNGRPVNVPMVMNLPMIGGDFVHFELSASIEHLGSPTSGHFIAHLRSGMDDFYTVDGVQPLQMTTFDRIKTSSIFIYKMVQNIDHLLI